MHDVGPFHNYDMRHWKDIISKFYATLYTSMFIYNRFTKVSSWTHSIWTLIGDEIRITKRSSYIPSDLLKKIQALRLINAKHKVLCLFVTTLQILSLFCPDVNCPNKVLTIGSRISRYIIMKLKPYLLETLEQSFRNFGFTICDFYQWIYSQKKDLHLVWFS